MSGKDCRPFATDEGDHCDEMKRADCFGLGKQSNPRNDTRGLVIAVILLECGGRRVIFTRRSNLQRPLSSCLLLL